MATTNEALDNHAWTIDCIAALERLNPQTTTTACLPFALENVMILYSSRQLRRPCDQPRSGPLGEPTVSRPTHHNQGLPLHARTATWTHPGLCTGTRSRSSRTTRTASVDGRASLLQRAHGARQAWVLPALGLGKTLAVLSSQKILRPFYFSSTLRTPSPTDLPTGRRSPTFPPAPPRGTSRHLRGASRSPDSPAPSPDGLQGLHGRPASPAFSLPTDAGPGPPRRLLTRPRPSSSFGSIVESPGARLDVSRGEQISLAPGDATHRIAG